MTDDMFRIVVPPDAVIGDEVPITNEFGDRIGTMYVWENGPLIVRAMSTPPPPANVVLGKEFVAPPGWQLRRDVKADTERGRRLASERDDLIAQGVDPADLLIPIAPEEGE